MADDSKHIGIVLFADVEELDAIGPWEVLSYWTRNFPEDGYTVSTLSRDGGLVPCAKGLRVQTDYSYADVPPLEVLLYPGGQGTRRQLHDEEQLNWVHRQRMAVPLMSSVCTGSLVYAAAGLLHGRAATTHWNSLDRLAELDPMIDVRTDERFVDDGNTARLTSTRRVSKPSLIGRLPDVSITVSGLASAPVKGMRLRCRTELRLEHHGPAGDREFLVTNAEDDRVLLSTRTPALLRIEPRWNPEQGVLALQFPDGTVVEDSPASGAVVTTRLYDGRRLSGRRVKRTPGHGVVGVPRPAGAPAATGCRRDRQRYPSGEPHLRGVAGHARHGARWHSARSATVPHDHHARRTARVGRARLGRPEDHRRRGQAAGTRPDTPDAWSPPTTPTPAPPTPRCCTPGSAATTT
jgi:putative intracellular protease/amidase